MSAGGEPFAREIRMLDIQNARQIKRRLTKKPYSGSFLVSFFSAVLGADLDNFYAFCRDHEMSPDCPFALRKFLTSWSYYLLPELIGGPYCPCPIKQIVFHDGPIDPLSDLGIVVTPAVTIPETSWKEKAEMVPSEQCKELLQRIPWRKNIFR